MKILDAVIDEFIEHLLSLFKNSNVSVLSSPKYPSLQYHQINLKTLYLGLG